MNLGHAGKKSTSLIRRQVPIEYANHSILINCQSEPERFAGISYIMP